MSTKVRTRTISFEDHLEQQLRDDPAFRELWERTAFAREVSLAVLRYRTAHDLTIEQLAERLGVDAEVVAVLEDGEEDPEIDVLRLLSEHLGLRFTIDIHPGEASGVEMIYSVA